MEILVAFSCPEVGYKLYPSGEITEFHIQEEINIIDDPSKISLKSELYTYYTVEQLLGQLGEDDWQFGFITEEVPFIGLWTKDLEGDYYIIKKVLPKSVYLYKRTLQKPEPLEKIENFLNCYTSTYNKLYSPETLELLEKFEFWNDFEYGFILL